MTVQLSRDDDARVEILRQASVALGGRTVMLWEVSDRAELEPRLSNSPHATIYAPADVRTALRSWNIPLLQGSRWVSCSGDAAGEWVLAPVRSRPPAPPPRGQERRRPVRLTLELAGLCLGLVEGQTAVSLTVPPMNHLRELENLPGVIAHELGNRLTSARASVQVAMEAVSALGEVPEARRLELIDELGQVLGDIDRGAQFVRAVKDRARGAMARWERFDAARVVQSCCTLEGRVLRERVALELASALEAVYLLGDPNALYDALVNVIRNAADASAGRAGSVRVGFERVGQTLHLTVRDQGQGIAPQNLDRIFDSGFTTKAFGEGTGVGLSLVRDVIHNMFGGTVSVESTENVGTTVTIALPIPTQRSGDFPPPRLQPVTHT
ncbi:MAG TPA: HAMP domain-containing sensor histidine kinase [Gemmatimonadales bacterium]|nr:HAMP domain-containing sensor histidine kinase [Gemmatimonadales bacterium]